MSDRLNSELLNRFGIINLLVNEPGVDDIIRNRAGEAVSDSVFMFGNQPLSQKRPFVQGPEQHGNGNPVCEKADHRSEERRVGKEGRAGWWRGGGKKE